MLKRGDTCPCCGNPIATDDPRALKILTEIADYLAATEAEKEGKRPIGYPSESI